MTSRCTLWNSFLTRSNVCSEDGMDITTALFTHFFSIFYSLSLSLSEKMLYIKQVLFYHCSVV